MINESADSTGAEVAGQGAKRPAPREGPFAHQFRGPKGTNRPRKWPVQVQKPREKVRYKVKKRGQVIIFSNGWTDFPLRRTAPELLHKLRDFSRNAKLKCRVCRICVT